VGKFKRKLTPYIPFLAKLFIIVAAISLVALLIRSIPIFLSRVTSNLDPSSNVAISLVNNPQKVLKSTKDRTNVLILGVGGASHETPDLTDTIILLSYSHKSKQAQMVSLPRDIWVDSMQAKLNTAYYYGNQKKSGGGLILSPAAVEEIIDQPIHYTVVIDFDSFIRLVNLVGGVDINVSESFDDDKYPIPGRENEFPISSRYELLQFDKGIQEMDGSRALKYARSRNSNGDQGTDYSRSVRQQQIIIALKTKIISKNILLNYQLLKQLLATISQATESDLTTAETLAFAKLSLGFKNENLSTFVLDDDLLINPPISTKYQNQWVLVGKNDSWDQVRQYVADLLQ
jgi:polyisoprenyl-teichoic acid--peptidoglycan teichoic acid transferase